MKTYDERRLEIANEWVAIQRDPQRDLTVIRALVDAFDPVGAFDMIWLGGVRDSIELRERWKRDGFPGYSI